MSADRKLGQTPSQTVGPFFAYALTPEQYGYAWTEITGPAMVDEGAAGERITLEGQVLDGKGAPITDALVEIWHADASGRYLSQPSGNSRFTGFGRCGTGMLGDGLYRFHTIRPGAPSPGEAAHINMIITMRGLLLHVFTRVYFADDPANASDPVLMQVPPERRGTLTAKQTAAGVWRFDIRMQGAEETVFLDL
jgi:protocatechuate 3,4-dioxygenase, alpha subunit